MRLADVINTVIGRFGMRVSRCSTFDAAVRNTLRQSMRTAASIGFHPCTVIDVGAARGSWTAAVAEIWPDARYFLIDPLEENRHALANTCSLLSAAQYTIAAAGDRKGTAVLNVHPDLDGSSLFREREEMVNGTPRDVVMTTVDGVTADGFEGPVLLKADVQGAELAVLAGASRTINATEMIVLEVVLFDFFDGNPQMHEAIAHLRSLGFVVWDIFGLEYRPLDGALSQVDIAFVREEGVFRRNHAYATDGQRLAQLTRIRATDPRRAGGLS